MARPIDEFVLAWNALSGREPAEGWRTIEVASAGPCTLLAARRFPGNEEALLAGFSAATAIAPLCQQLPEGQGFDVSRAEGIADGKTWIAISRKQPGSISLFAEMVADLAGVMDSETRESADELRILHALLGRIRAWQEFMRKGAQALGPEAELGLIGELLVLSLLIDLGVTPAIAAEAWVGPLDAPQDIHLGSGAIEVKTTLSSRGFLAKIGSLEQLDDSVRQPLYVVGVRLSLSPMGRNLVEIVGEVRTRVAGDASAVRLISDCLLAAGYYEAHAAQYRRQFGPPDLRVLRVTDTFPRLVAGTVPSGVKAVSYIVDLDQVPRGNFDLLGALKTIGVM